MQPDVIIIGAGSAGCVMANRLSEDASRQVLLLEAGPVFPVDGYPPELRDADRITRTGKFNWGLRSRTGGHAPAFDVAAARVAGGGSAVNAGNIRRGRRDDFERWAKRGVPGWSFDDVMGTYLAMENTPDGRDDAHGRTGPLPVRQLKPAEATQTQRAFVAACVKEGFAEIEDYNGADQRGVALMAKNVVDGVRMNAGIVYLTADVRARANLTIRERTQVDRVEFTGRRAVGVRIADGETLRAGEVILCAGTYHSPTLLMRSGVGPASHLAEFGIAVLADLPVGQGLRDHPAYFSTYALRKDVRDMHPAAGAVLATPAAESAPEDLDLWVFAYNLFIPPMLGKLGRPTLMLGAAVMRPRSTGTVRLRGRSPGILPRIDFNLLADPSDQRRMLAATRLARRLARTAPLADLIDHETGPGADSADDDDALMAAIAGSLGTFDHGCGTAAMGGDDDPHAVTDRRGRVRQVEGLRVVDASVFPDILSVPLNLSTMMLAERIAAEMRAAVWISHSPPNKPNPNHPNKNTIMPNQEYQKMYVENLQALVVASEMSEQSSAGYVNAITSLELKEMVASGAKIAKEHNDTIKDLLRKAGGQPSPKPNQVMAGIIEAGKDSVTSAGDPGARDAAVIATLQVALHYYIAVYGTVASTAKHLGRQEEAQTVARLNEWMKGKDADYTRLAEGMIS